MNEVQRSGLENDHRNVRIVAGVLTLGLSEFVIRTVQAFKEVTPSDRDLGGQTPAEIHREARRRNPSIPRMP